MKKYLFPILLFPFLLSSCYTLKPDSLRISDPDYNKRRTVYGAYYKKKNNGIGIAVNIGATVAGGVIGYRTPLINYRTDTEMKTVKPANAAVGAIIGFSTANLISYLLGKNKTVPTNSSADWIYKANKNYKLLSQNSIEDFTVINKTVESNYEVKNINDIHDFVKVFPKSKYSEEVFAIGLKNLNREKIPLLMSNFPNSTNLDKAKYKYIDLCDSLNTFFSAIDKYPEIAYKNKQEKALNLIKSHSDGFAFLNRYPDSPLKKSVFIEMLTFNYFKGTDLSKIKNIIGEDINLKATDFEDVDILAQKNYLSTVIENRNPKTIPEIVSIYREFNFLNFSDKHNFLLNKIWDKSYDQYDKGNDLIGYLYAYGTSEKFKDLKISKSKVTEFINKKLNKETQKITVKLKGSFDSRNSHFEDFGTTIGDAWVVSEDGFSEIFYGVIKNHSKFDLPLEVLFTADRIREKDIEVYNTGLGGFLKSFINATKPDLLATERVEQHTKKFIVPLIKPNEAIPFAVLFEINGSTASGVQFIMTVKTEDKLTNFNYKPMIHDGNFTSTQKSQQDNWLKVSQVGFSKNSGLIDYSIIGSREYDPMDYVVDPSFIEQNKTEVTDFELVDKINLIETNYCDDAPYMVYEVICKNYWHKEEIIHFTGYCGSLFSSKSKGFYSVGLLSTDEIYDVYSIDQAAAKVCSGKR